MCALPADAPTVVIDTDANTVTLTKTLDWYSEDSGGQPYTQGDVTLVFPYLGSPFDPAFSLDAVNFAPNPDYPQVQEALLPGSAGVALPALRGPSAVHASSGLGYGLFTGPADSVQAPFSPHGMAFQTMLKTFPSGSNDGQVWYDVMISMNEDFTAIKDIFVDAVVETEIYIPWDGPGTGGITTERYAAWGKVSDFIPVSDFLLPAWTAPVPTAGDDLLDLSGAETGIALDALGGDDTVAGSAHADTLDGGAGDDVIRGGFRSDLIGGGSGDDVIHGQRGMDRIRGDGGDDRLNGNFGNDRLWGNADDDRLDGGFGDDTLSDGQGEDALLGREGADVFEMALDGDKDEIRDYEDGTDLIDLSAWGVAFGDLAIETRPIGGVRITWNDEMLILKTKSGTIAAADIDSGDFLF